MAEKKSDRVRVCIDISRDDHETVQKYNEGNIQPLILTRVASVSIAREIERIKKEMAARENSTEQK
jgi:hypothetical protein